MWLSRAGERRGSSRRPTGPSGGAFLFEGEREATLKVSVLLRRVQKAEGIHCCVCSAFHGMYTYLVGAQQKPVEVRGACERRFKRPEGWSSEHRWRGWPVVGGVGGAPPWL